MELKDVIVVNNVLVLSKNGNSISKDGQKYLFDKINNDMTHNYALADGAKYFGGNLLNSPRALIELLSTKKDSCLVCISTDEKTNETLVDILFEEDYDKIIRFLEHHLNERSWDVITKKLNAQFNN